MKLLNKKSKIIHLLVTECCRRNCKYCCNKQYDLNKVPRITDEEFKNASTILLTGGEPVIYTNPSKLALEIKNKYPNIKNVYVYANACELGLYINDGGSFDGIDGFSISIKNEIDLIMFNKMLSNNVKLQGLKSNRVYYFENLKPNESMFFECFKREWQKKFVPANDSIFRKY